ncbi:MAG TPA: 3-(methylthio)propionyl-CoA ligase [Hyphomicrobiales bacterium]|nr:3-(methylthio)propionyl-CoA ligase [Hyphomicrobiales bacterium]
MHCEIMNMPLNVSSILRHAETVYGKNEIVSRLPESGIWRYTYAEAASRARRLANALVRLGVHHQDRVGTLAWNTHRHYELYYAVSGSGAIIHTVNPRLFPDQIVYIINHAEDAVLFLDATFLPLVEKIRPELKSVKHFVLLAPREHMPKSSLPLLCYEELLAAENDSFDWPVLHEQLASALCYTSGTTGNPKGVLYGHRSTVIHAYAAMAADALGVSSRGAILPVVPMFHVNAWGIPYSATMAGAKLVLPAAQLDGASLYKLMTDEKVNFALGVPTVWLGLLQYCDKENLKMETLEYTVIGGSACPESMIRAFQEKHDVFVIHAWGMTETSPLGTVNSMSAHMASLPLEERYKLQAKQGRPMFGVELKIVGPDGKELPHDGKAFGRLLVRGPWVASGYYKHEDRSSWHDGWFDTGDVATIDETGTMNIVDRAKDVIKSGGEWISSVELENIGISHPAVAECAVVGVPHPKWDERPILLVVRKEGKEVTKAQMLAFFEGKIAKWWMPDEVLFVPSLPHTATGKLLKRQLREEYRDILMSQTVAAS